MTITRVRSQVQFLPSSRPGHRVFAELGVIAVLTLVYALWRG